MERDFTSSNNIQRFFTDDHVNNEQLGQVCSPASHLCGAAYLPPFRSPLGLDTYHSRVSQSSSRPVSTTSSTYPMLAESRYDPPSAPFTPRPFLLSRPASPSSTSLTVNYVPSKFSTALVAPDTGPYRRKGRGDPLGLPKRGGGVEAFRSGESRIGNIYDDDYNDGYSKGKKKMKWTKFKWILLIANTLVRFSSFFL